MTSNIVFFGDVQLATVASGESVSVDTLETIDDDWHTIDTLSLDVDTLGIFRSIVLAKGTGIKGRLIRTVGVENEAGVVSVAIPQSDYTNKNNDDLNFRYLADGAQILLQVKGVNSLVSWWCKTYIYTL